MTNIAGKESPEMYLKAIYLIHQEKNYCRHVDISNKLDVSKSSVSVAISKLEKEEFLKINEDGMILLTAAGQERAKIVYEKFCFWTNFLQNVGIDKETAQKEACKVEHVLSDDAFAQIRLNTQADK